MFSVVCLPSIIVADRRCIRNVGLSFIAFAIPLFSIFLLPVVYPEYHLILHHFRHPQSGNSKKNFNSRANKKPHRHMVLHNLCVKLFAGMSKNGCQVCLAVYALCRRNSLLCLLRKCGYTYPVGRNDCKERPVLQTHASWE
jgi:hypothetical protein